MQLASSHRRRDLQKLESDDRRVGGRLAALH